MSSTGCARNGPLKPPETNSETKPMANSIGVWNRMRPLYSVPSQLNVLMAEGTPIAHGHDGEGERRVRAHAAHEHVMAPDHEAQDSRSP